MSENSYRSIQTLLSSSKVEDLRAGLALVKQEIARVGSREARPLFEMVSALFYIDPLDHPELMPILDEAVGLVIGFGDWVIPTLLENLEIEDLKVQLAIGQALGRIGADAIGPLLRAYEATDDAVRRSFILYTLGKIKSPKIIQAMTVILEAAHSPDREMLDTATRALGKLAESIPPGGLVEEVRQECLARLQFTLADGSPSIRAKAVRSLGKLARYGHLTTLEREQLAAICRRLVGKDDQFEWDRAYIVRKEAEEALQYL
jgi:hypothetical protein